MRLFHVVSALSTCFALIAVNAPLHAQGRLHPQRQPYSWTDPNCPTATSPPGTVAPQPKTTPVDPSVPAVPSTQPAPTAEPSFAPMVSAALGDSSFAAAAPGYIDFAKPMNQIRLRYDAAYDMNRPDRAEFFYAKCGCFGGNAPGPLLPERSVDAQETSLYIELAPSERFSVFIDVPFRSINPVVNDNNTGIGDLRFGFKYAFLYDECQIVTFQLRAFVPTGDARQGLGTDHSTLEPTLLLTRMLSDKLTLYGEFGAWIPLDGTDFAGNILVYGAGLGYTAYESNDFRVTPLVELVGWTVLDGQQLNIDAGRAVNAGGDTIINGKLGVRAGSQRQDFYVGYGRALTGEVWYQEIVRFEYRYTF